MSNKTMRIQLKNKRRLYGGYHELAWGDAGDWRTGHVSTKHFRDWKRALGNYSLLIDKFRTQGYKIEARKYN